MFLALVVLLEHHIAQHSTWPWWEVHIIEQCNDEEMEKKNFLHFFSFCDHKNPPAEREFNELKSLRAEIISKLLKLVLAKCLLFSVFFCCSPSQRSQRGLFRWNAEMSANVRIGRTHIGCVRNRVVRCARDFFPFTDNCCNLFNRLPFPSDNIQREMEWNGVDVWWWSSSHHWWMCLAFPSISMEFIERHHMRASRVRLMFVYV